MLKHALIAAALLLLPAGAQAAGDLATKAVKLEPLVLGMGDDDYAMSVKEYKLTTGQAYNWVVRSSGHKEYGLVAADLFRNIWLRHVAINDLEVKAAGLHELEFDDAGEMEIVFVPIRPGTFEFRIKQFADKGMVGAFIVE